MDYAPSRRRQTHTSTRKQHPYVTLQPTAHTSRPKLASITQESTPSVASFWKNGYPLVRKELRGRYPKHSWPEDPLTAEAVRGVRRRTDRG